MVKDRTICFRTTEDLRDTLEGISMKQRRSVSSLIEEILSSCLKEKFRPAEQERRRFPRKEANIPARIEGLIPGGTALYEGAILDISLSGMRIAIPDSLSFKLMEDGTDTPVSLIFKLPHGNKPMTIQCMPRYTQHRGTETHIGASYANADFASYQVLQDFLIN